MSYPGIKLNNITFDDTRVPLYKGVDIGLTIPSLDMLIILYTEKYGLEEIFMNKDGTNYYYAQNEFDNTMENFYNQSPIIIRDKKIDEIL